MFLNEAVKSALDLGAKLYYICSINYSVFGLREAFGHLPPGARGFNTCQGGTGVLNNYWFMLALVAAVFAVMNFINVRFRKRQDEASESVESVEITKAAPLPKKSMNINEAASPEVLSKRRHNKGW